MLELFTRTGECQQFLLKLRIVQQGKVIHHVCFAHELQLMSRQHVCELTEVQRDVEGFVVLVNQVTSRQGTQLFSEYSGNPGGRCVLS